MRHLLGKYLNFELNIKDPLYENALYLMLSSICAGGFGFLFWIIAAKLYSPTDFGLASAMIAIINLIVLLTKLGFDFSIIRFIPTMEKELIYNTAASITVPFAVLLGTFFLLNINTLSPQLAIINNNLGLFFIVVLAATSYTSLAGTAFIATRKSRLYFLQNVSMGLRLLFLFPFVYLGFSGIYLAFGLSTLLLLGITIIFLYYIGIRPRFAQDRVFIGTSFRFSLSNYINNILVIAPYHLLPIIVLNFLGAEEAAYYYVTFSITSLLLTLPNNLSTSLFVEGSHGAPTKESFLKAISLSYLILFPLLMVLFITGEQVLNFMGSDYIEGLDLLRVLCVSTVFMTFISLYYSIMRIKENLRGLIALGGLIFVVLIGSSYLFMDIFGITGVGYAWLLSSITGCAVIIISTRGLKTV